jgi:hypothetical protein
MELIVQINVEVPSDMNDFPSDNFWVNRKKYDEALSFENELKDLELEIDFKR